MSALENVTLEDLGWNFYYDEDGKYPVQKDSFINVSPSEVLDLYYRSPPQQEDNGDFVGYEIEANKLFPYFFFGFYEKKEVSNTFQICGVSTENNSMNGKIESFSMWNKGIDDASIVAYHTNTMKMIGNDISYMYQDDQEAVDHGLVYHYYFGEQNIISYNFNSSSSALKNRRLEIGQGKTANASILDEIGDLVIIDRLKMYPDFTMNIRFFLEEIRDFSLFYSSEIMQISLDKETNNIVFDFYPYIGNIKTVYVLKSDLRLHHWYDLAVKYKDGTVSIFIDGEKEKETNINIEIGGVYSYNVNHENISNIFIETHKNRCIFELNAYMYHGTSPYQRAYSSSFELEKGGNNLKKLFMGENNTGGTTALKNRNEPNNNATVTEDSIGLYTYKIPLNTGYASGRDCYIRVSSLENNRCGFESHITDSGLHQGYMNGYKGNILSVESLLPNGGLKITITFKSQLSTVSVFPMLFTIPSLPIRKIRRVHSGDTKYLKWSGLPDNSGYRLVRGGSWNNYYQIWAIEVFNYSSNALNLLLNNHTPIQIPPRGSHIYNSITHTYFFTDGIRWALNYPYQYIVYK